MKKTILFLSAIIFLNPIISAQNSESEPNEANTFPLNGTMGGNIGQTVNTVTDWYDWFKLTTDYDGKISLIGIPSGGLNLKITLYDTNGSTVIKDALLNGTGVNDTLNYNSLSAGTYYIRIAVDGGQGAYTLENALTPAEFPDGNDTEPNNTSALASNLTINTSQTGHIGFYGNSQTDFYDWFVFTMNYDGKLSIIGIPASTLNLKLTLYETNASSVIKDAGLNEIGENDTIIINDLSAGTYYLRLAIDSGFGPYTILANFDGTSTFVESVEIPTFTVFPNPCLYQINLKSDVGLKNLSINSILGEKLVFKEILGKRNYSLPTSDLKKGIYILSVEDIDGNRKTLRVIKQ